MDTLDKLIQLIADHGGPTTLFFVATCALGLFAWHQHLRIKRLLDDASKEANNTARLEKELLQVKAAARSQERQDRRQPGGRRAPSRVLVVEDNKAMQVVIEQMLDKCLIAPDVHVRASTSEAVEEIDSFHPDLLILDLVLGGANGIEVLKYLRTTKTELPVLIYSAYDDQIELVRQLREQVGIENLTVLQKGSDYMAFMQLVPTLFRRRSTDQHPHGTEAEIAGMQKRERRRASSGRRSNGGQSAEPPSEQTLPTARAAAGMPSAQMG
jgi:CheY-like chemotaxis protein